MDKKITTMFLKQIRNKTKLGYTEDEENYYLSDGYIMFAIPKDEMELNINKFTLSLILNERIESFRNEDYKKANLKYFIPGENGLIAKISSDKFSAYIQESYYKFFKDCEFKIKGKVSPVACYRDEKLVGVVMPIRMEER